MDSIKLTPLWHRDELFIAIKGNLRGEVFATIDNWKGRKYSATHKCYLILYEPSVLEQLQLALGSHACLEASGWGNIALPTPLTKAWVTLPALYSQTMRTMRYATATIQNYESQFKSFLRFIYPKTSEDFDDADIHKFMLHLVEERQVSIATQNQAINSIKYNCLG